MQYEIQIMVGCGVWMKHKGEENPRIKCLKTGTQPQRGKKCTNYLLRKKEWNDNKNKVYQYNQGRTCNKVIELGHFMFEVVKNLR